MSRIDNITIRKPGEVVLEGLAGIFTGAWQGDSDVVVRRMPVQMDHRDPRVRVLEAIRRDFISVGNDLRIAIQEVEE